MDESLLDFQEKKKSLTRPTRIGKPSGSKPQPKKAPKRIRGQKDIRTALKPKKNELISYANDFDKVCKESGIDIDSEQLQLAIALSKSLLSEADAETNDSQSLRSSNAQRRVGKIRTTLQEYGFKVPEVKEKLSKNRRLKRHKKHYKLLLTTEAEKKQVISDRYSQILFENVDTKFIDENKEQIDFYEVRLYHIATQCTYEEIKSNNTFYVEDLIEKSQNSPGCLLRDWSGIPGRPASPNLCGLSSFNFSEIDCTQDELNNILSGSLKTTQDFFENIKTNVFQKDTLTSQVAEKNIGKIGTNIGNNCIIAIKMDDNERTDNDIRIQQSNDKLNLMKLQENDAIEIIDDDSPQTLSFSVTPQVRSCSPDIFDDEVSEIMGSTKENTGTVCFDLRCNTAHTKNYRDLNDDCVNVFPHGVSAVCNIEKLKSQCSQGSNNTKRKSNDFMEITDCVSNDLIEITDCIALSSQPILISNNRDENVDLTQSSDSDVSLITDKSVDNLNTTNVLMEKENMESMDLTQSSDTDDDLPLVQISGQETYKESRSLDDKIILNDNALNGVSYKVNNFPIEKSILIETEKKNVDSPVIDIVSNNEVNIKTDRKIVGSPGTDSCSNDDVNFGLPTKTFDSTPKSDVVSNKPITHTVTIESEEEESRHTLKSDPLMKSPEMTESVSEKPKTVSKIGHHSKSKTESFFEEFLYPHSDDGSNKETEDEILFIDESKSTVDHDLSPENENNEIDLTQNMNYCEEAVNVGGKIRKSPQLSYGSLGKRDDVSIDYDEIFDDVVNKHNSKQRNISHNSVASDIIGDNNTGPYKKDSKHSTSDLVSNSSQNSEVFEISDKEFNYSLNQSRPDRPIDNFDLGGISIVNNLSSNRISTATSNIENEFTIHDLNRSMSDSYLPMVKIKHKEVSPIKICETKSSFSPFKERCKVPVSIKTPTNREYIVKTSDVTPLLDYASMTTPERNQELDKYGLKPLKRKRAIQLLNHLYNETHPIVESCLDENLPSPSKKVKQNHTQPSISPKKSIRSPKKSSQLVKSPRKSSQLVKSPRKCSENIEGLEKDNDVYEVTDELPDIRDIECSEEDWVFQKREKAKVPSCRVPLHVALHNYVCCRRALRDAILRYQPVNIDVIHKGLVSSGHRYDPKDLLKFLDKKCITVKTADSRNNKKHY